MSATRLAAERSVSILTAKRLLQQSKHQFKTEWGIVTLDDAEQLRRDLLAAYLQHSRQYHLRRRLPFPLLHMEMAVQVHEAEGTFMEALAARTFDFVFDARRHCLVPRDRTAANIHIVLHQQPLFDCPFPAFESESARDALAAVLYMAITRRLKTHRSVSFNVAESHSIISTSHVSSSSSSAAVPNSRSQSQQASASPQNSQSRTGISSATQEFNAQLLPDFDAEYKRLVESMRLAEAERADCIQMAPPDRVESLFSLWQANGPNLSAVMHQRAQQWQSQSMQACSSADRNKLTDLSLRLLAPAADANLFQNCWHFGVPVHHVPYLRRALRHFVGVTDLNSLVLPFNMPTAATTTATSSSSHVVARGDPALPARNPSSAASSSAAPPVPLFDLKSLLSSIPVHMLAPHQHQQQSPSLTPLLDSNNPSPPHNEPLSSISSPSSSTTSSSSVNLLSTKASWPLSQQQQPAPAPTPASSPSSSSPATPTIFELVSGNSELPNPSGAQPIITITVGHHPNQVNSFSKPIPSIIVSPSIQSSPSSSSSSSSSPPPLSPCSSPISCDPQLSNAQSTVAPSSRRKLDVIEIGDEDCLARTKGSQKRPKHANQPIVICDDN